ncbi:Tetratricopeptide TPR_2 repeat protein [Shewanella halifaxensis HAW-EB4]|uniref:Tetratricopeptide TPR_2 repeat protein n=1 Tax=Shewanella halifaxensis (strain HAW-EB4) TaxID=458817 RepID=B0TL27_SHEHH|nr:VWA domain-containing protein [Shewanella halifaxensis]ABZ77229.1 Tetratricopeptide TPR_2 repeat protein [Shewanella halifaxensis HAW-EB4]
MHFLRPEWFLALIPLGLLLLFLYKSKTASSSWNHYIAPHLAKILVGGSIKKKHNNITYLAIAWFIAVFALSGPAFEKKALPVYESAQGRVIVMDMSQSMYANDLAPNRLTQAKFKATDLIDELPDGETGLIAYAGDAFTISPLTRDKATLLNLLPTLTPSIMPIKGSNLEAAITQAKSLLSQGGHIRGDIILFTDGISSTQFKRAESVLKDSQYRLAIIAFGSQQGSPIKLPDGQLLRDSANQIVVAKTDYGLLKQLASDANGILVPSRADGSDITQITQWLASTQDTKASDLEGEVWQDLGPYFALLLLLPALLSFRNGMIATFALFMLIQPSEQAYASTWNDLWQTQDQQAMQAYKADDYQAAAEQFVTPQWQASALYKAGEYEQALSAFEKDDSANGLYNQGNALMQQGKYAEAQKRYQSALDKEPQFDAAKSNLALAKNLQQQQEQQNADQSEQQSSDEQSQQDPSQNEKSQDGQSQQDKSQDAQSQDEKSQDKKSQDGQPSSDKSEDEQSSEQQSQEQQSQQQSEPSQQEQSQQDQAQQGSEQQSSNQTEANNEAEMQAEPEPPTSQQPMTENAEANKAQEQDKQGEQEHSAARMQAETDKESEQSDAESQQVAASAVPTDEPLPPEMERALRAIADDPQVLLRNKMQLEYQKRRQQGINSKENEQW